MNMDDHPFQSDSNPMPLCWPLSTCQQGDSQTWKGGCPLIIIRPQSTTSMRLAVASAAPTQLGELPLPLVNVAAAAITPAAAVTVGPSVSGTQSYPPNLRVPWAKPLYEGQAGTSPPRTTSLARFEFKSTSYSTDCESQFEPGIESSRRPCSFNISRRKHDEHHRTMIQSQRAAINH